MPFVDSKGSFGKVYSRDMAYAASRYTEAKLAPICAELFGDIDKDTVDFVDNYDGTMKEPALLPTAFPNVLVSANTGIAVGMASQICGFNLTEVCETAINYIRDPGVRPHGHAARAGLPDRRRDSHGHGRHARDIPHGPRQLQGPLPLALRRQGRTSSRSTRYHTPPRSRPSWTRSAELVKAGKCKEIADMRDETDLGGLKLAIDLKRGADPDRLMAKLFKLTPLMDSFACNFNILIAGTPRVMGVGEILGEWVSWRTECVKRRIYFDLKRKKREAAPPEGPRQDTA